MNATRLLFTSLATLGAGFASLLPAPPVPAGPGGVLDATRAFLAAIDRGDRDYLESALAEAHGMNFGIDAQGKTKQLDQGATPPLFVEAGPDGSAAIGMGKDFVGALLALGADAKGGRRVKTGVSAILADCPSGDCSYAVVAFERQWTIGERTVTVPMRATALFRHSNGKPNFKLFRWHASVGPSTARVSAAK